VLDEKARENLLYDDILMQRSKFYFSTLQLLRIFSGMISAATEDLENLAKSSRIDLNCIDEIDNHKPTSEFIRAREAAKRNWDAVISHQKKIGSALLDRISKKTVDIESLRDGVSPHAQVPLEKRPRANKTQLLNAQSVREAIKATQFSRYLLVFTIVTIIYLPPTFSTVRILNKLALFEKPVTDIMSNNRLSPECISLTLTII
jgi:hypothetical protein